MPFFRRKMETRRLHGADMKELVRILRNDPYSSIEPGLSEYDKATEAIIKKLPRRLRSYPLSSHGKLCRTHKGLNTHLIEDIWAWIKFELEVAIGRFLYPVIVSDVMSEEDEIRVRQLEPVVEIFNPHWTLDESAPPGNPPIDAGKKWAFQQNGCPACILARIGSDEDALFALFVGMYGHLRGRSDGQGVDKIKSKRLRFVRYWMRTHTNGEKATFAAYDLGMELKALRGEAKATLRKSGQPNRFTRDSIDEPVVTTHNYLDGQAGIALDVSEPYNSKDWTDSDHENSKIGLTPPQDPTTPVVVNGRNDKPLPKTPRASIHIQPLTPSSSKSHRKSMHSTRSMEEDTLPPLPNLSRPNLKRRDSVFSSSSSLRPPRPASSVYSSPSFGGSRLTLATSVASYNNPSSTHRSCAPRYDPFDTSEDRMAKYRKMLKGTPVHQGANRVVEVQEKTLFPKPSRGSLYSAFGEEGWEEKEKEFETVDVTPPPSPVLEGVDEEGEEYYEEDDDGEQMRVDGLMPCKHK